MIVLTDAERVIYQTRLTEAEGALHTINIGGGVRTVVDQNGERVEYNAANRAGLRAYILELRLALGLPTGILGPMHVWFP